MRAIIAIVSIVALTACSKPDPIACFTYKNLGIGSVGSGPAGTHTEYFVRFTPCSCYAHWHQWKFPEATFPEMNDSEGGSPMTTTYLDTGTYNATLIVFSKNDKKTDSITQIVHVTP